MTANQECFSAIRDGDHEAFERLFRTHFDELLRFVWGYVGSEAIAEEIIQELFLRLWKDAKRIKVTGSLRSYLFAAARNMSIDYTRHQKVKKAWKQEKKALYDPVQTSTIDEQLHKKMLLKDVKEAIQELPERRREVFVLSRYERMSYREIADFLEISVSTVETQMSRALKTLRAQFGSYIPALILALFL